jgi:hypothetical protein
MERTQVLLDDFVVDAVVGYRTWVAMVEQGVVSLRSIFKNIYWKPNEPLAATCLCGTTPRFGGRYGKECRNECGIYAWDAVHLTCIWASNCQGWVEVHGEVLLWGDVHVHQAGYRAQYAKPSCIYLTPNMKERPRRIAELVAMQFHLPTVQSLALERLL